MSYLRAAYCTSGIICIVQISQKLLFANYDAWNLLKSGNFNSKLGKKIEIFKFDVSRFTFQDVIYNNKIFTSISYLHYQHKHCDLKPYWSGISFILETTNLERFISIEMFILCIFVQIKYSINSIKLPLPGNNLENIWNFMFSEKWESYQVSLKLVHNI